MFFVQKALSERQRRWALEDEERKKEFEREAGQMRIKRDLLSRRLDILEEATKIMINDTGRTLGEMLGMPTFSDKDTVQKQRQRLEEIAEEAWAIVLALDSKDMTDSWGAVTHAYWKQLETGDISSEDWNNTQKAYVKIVKLTDELRSKS